ncbi:hypothetical protein AQUCO_00300119v1 [Aquilegia coerulea]|uniref:Amino acid transporter transmembrane domain-containing protein n=1 Tax=Aquilegia coerulea TaxID=218851 RepID=A0A2G5EXD4_AQUCA|nr:hypothetical protein AQUCO_00300119v1 [Aquilegia coerulea]
MESMRDEEVGWERNNLLENEEEEEQDHYNVEQEEESDKEAVNGLRSRNPSEYSASYSSYHLSWPQTYKQSMDLIASMKPSKDDFLEKISLGTRSTSSSMYKRQNASGFDSALCESLLSTTILENKDFPSLTRSSTGKISYHGKSASQQCSFTQSVLNGINVLCGLGLLSIPSAVKGGWLGLLILFLFGVISCYTGILLKRCLDSSPEVQTYADIGQAGFGKVGRLAVAIVLYIELYASCVELITLMSDDLASVFPNAHLSFCGFHLNPNYVFSIIGALTVLPTVWLRNLTGGVISSLVVVLCLLWIGVVDQVGFHPSGTALELSNLPIAIGLYAVCYTGHSVFPNIYTSMEKPSQFPTVLIVCFTTCWLLYTGVAVCGFMMFGDALESQFTLNMPHQFVASKIAVWTTVVNPLTKYASTITPVALSLEELLPASQLKSYYISLIVRTALVFSTLVVVLTVPYFNLNKEQKILSPSPPDPCRWGSNPGQALMLTMALIFPCACYLKILSGRLSRVEIVTCAFIIMVGLVCCCIGSYSAITKIVDKLRGPN